MLGVPNAGDRMAQTAAAMLLEEKLEPVFHPDSYGYRSGRSALDALAVTRTRCWKQDWAVDLDIRAFFDSVPPDLLLKAVAHHTDERWVLLYIARWLKSPMQMTDGTLVPREKGTTATPRNRPKNFGTTSPAGSGPLVSSCTLRRRRSCSARTRTAQGNRSTSPSISWATPSGAAWPAAGEATS